MKTSLSQRCNVLNLEEVQGSMSKTQGRKFRRFEVEFEIGMLKRITTSALVVCLIALGLLVTACNRNSGESSNDSSSSQPTVAASPKSAFERDLQFIRNGQYTYVWVFSRADGKPLDRDDASFLRKSAPQVVDWAITDEGRRVIGGTNFDLEKGGMPELRKRFVVEDYTGK